jgi:GNAT superfamily N-acetyltransferase
MGCEKMADLTEVLSNMFIRQRLEVEPHIPVDTHFDFASFLEMEATHQAVLFTVRHHGTLAGNIIYILTPDMSEGGAVTASDHGFYLEPEHRKGNLARQLMDYSAATLKKLGVVGIYMGDKSPVGAPDLGPLFTRAGFKLVSRTYLKRL